MTKRVIIAGIAIAAVLIGTGVLLYLNHLRQSPAYLLRRLARARDVGERNELLMRLNVARGNVVGAVLDAYNKPDAAGEFRAILLELLFKRNLRAREDRIERALRAAMKDRDSVVRRKAATCVAAYADEDFQAALADLVDDPDPQVRRQVYLVLGSVGSYSAPADPVWERMSPEQERKVVETCLKRMKTEETAEMRTLARAIIGRKIEIYGNQALEALQASEIAGAEELLRKALALDGESHQARIRLVRFLLKSGQKDRALALARQYNALIEVPRLSAVPKIDGDPTDDVWDEAYKADTFYHTTSRWVARRTKGKSQARIGHRDGKIYIAIIGYEEDLSRLIRKTTQRDGAVWRDDCAEILFDPALTEKDYYQFVINSIGGLFDQKNRNRRLDFRCEYAAGIFDDRGYWACEFALDGKDLENHPIRPGTMWALNMFRTRIGPASEHGAMWPVYGQTARKELYPVAVFE